MPSLDIGIVDQGAPGTGSWAVTGQVGGFSAKPSAVVNMTTGTNYVTGDGGATWSNTQITFGLQKYVRPFIARNRGTDKFLCYMHGTYLAYNSLANTEITLK